MQSSNCHLVPIILLNQPVQPQPTVLVKLPNPHAAKALPSNAVNEVVSQMKAVAPLIETQTADEDAKLIQDARIVSRQIEQNRQVQHLLAEHQRIQQLKAVYSDFLQWVDGVTAATEPPNEPSSANQSQLESISETVETSSNRDTSSTESNK